MYCKINADSVTLAFFHLPSSHNDLYICQAIPRCRVARRSIISQCRVEFSHDDAMHSKWTKAVIIKLQRVG